MATVIGAGSASAASPLSDPAGKVGLSLSNAETGQQQILAEAAANPGGYANVYIANPNNPHNLGTVVHGATVRVLARYLGR